MGYKYKVYHVGVHARDVLEPERRELEKINAEQVVLPRLETEDEMIEAIKKADGIINVESPVTRKFLEQLEGCKVVVRTGVGVDVVDVDAATELGIAVVNVPDLWPREVANHAISMMLALNRRLFVLNRLLHQGEWVPIIPPPVGALHGETIGVVGMGQIGKLLVKRVKAFEMNVIVSDPYLDPKVFSDYGVEQVGFGELLSRSDYISIHCPLTEETKHLFNDNAFDQMKTTAYLVNTSRGPIVETDALVRAMQEKKIMGAGLDVLEKEPNDGKIETDNILLSFENLLISPHAAYYSDKAISDLPVRCGQEVVRVLSGYRPINLVNPDVLNKLPLREE